jgi:transcriptional regulator with XRE-family HTH domain
MTPAEYRQFLRKHGLTQAEFAELLGHSYRAGQYWATTSVPGSVATWVRYIEGGRPEALEALRNMARGAASADATGKAVRL